MSWIGFGSAWIGFFVEVNDDDILNLCVFGALKFELLFLFTIAPDGFISIVLIFEKKNY